MCIFIYKTNFHLEGCIFFAFPLNKMNEWNKLIPFIASSFEAWMSKLDRNESEIKKLLLTTAEITYLFKMITLHSRET